MPDTGGGFDPSQFPGMTDEEVQQLTQVIRANASDCAPPNMKFAIPNESVKELFRYICGILRELDMPRWQAVGVAGLACLPLFVFNAIFSLMLTVLRPLLSSLFKEVLGLMDVLRKDLDPSFADAAVLVLNELLGTDFNSGHLAQGLDVQAHLDRASEVGGLFHQQLLREFRTAGDVTPEAGRAAANRFTGFLINFGTATGIIGAIGGLVPFVHLNEMREIGEEVAKNLGLGRLHRQVMKPLINTLVTVPYQWWLNQQFHPTQFKEGDLINPFQQTLMSHDVIFQQMDLLGYSQDKIEELIKLHHKRLTFDEVDLLLRFQIWSPDEAHQYILTLGYPEELASLVLYLVDLRKADKALTSLVDAMETSTVDGHTTPDEFSSLLDSLPLSAYDKRFRLQAVQYKVKAPRAHLTTAQAEKAFEEGLWTLDELDAYFAARGFSFDDNMTLQFQTLLALAKQADAAKVKAAKAAAAAAKAAKKTGTIPPPAIA